MRAEHPGDNKWLDRMGLMIAAPLIVMVGAIVVVILSTPNMIAMTMVVFATALLWMASVVTRQPMTFMVEKEEEMCETADMMVGLEEKTVEMVTALTAASVVPVTATITKVVGPCPLGMMPGNMWKIGPDGKLSRPICRLGATALSALLKMSKGDALDMATCCECEYEGREVTFTVREPEEELV